MSPRVSGRRPHALLAFAVLVAGLLALIPAEPSFAAGASASISGIVTDERGTPVTAATVSLLVEANGAWESVATTRTTADGSYTASNLRADEYRLLVTPGTGSDLLPAYSGGADTVDGATSTFLRQAATASVDVRLRDGSSVSGTVTDTEGASLEGATVTVLAQDERGDWTSRGRATTATDGTYRVPALRPATYRVGVDPRVTGNGLVAGEYWPDAPTLEQAADVVVKGTEPTRVDVQLDPYGSVSGSVTDPDGAPLGGVHVAYHPVEPDGRFSDHAAGDHDFVTTWSDGRFSLEALAPGQYEFDLSLEGWLTTDSGIVDVRPGAETVVPVVLTRGGIVSGTVTAGGQPREGVGVLLARQGATSSANAKAVTDAAGHYKATGLATGDYLVRFTSSGSFAGEYWGDADTAATATPIHVVEGAETRDISPELDPTATVAGRVTDRTGRPIAYAWVDVTRVDGSLTAPTVAQGYTGTDGRYRLTEVPRGKHAVRFSSDAYLTGLYGGSSGTGEGDLVTVAAGAEVTGIDGVLSRGGRISGRLTTPAGAAPDDVTVRAFRASAAGSWTMKASASPSASGSWTFANLPAGVYRLGYWWEAAGRYVAYYGRAGSVPSLEDAGEVDLADGGTVTGVDGSLAVGGRITGDVTDGDGIALSDRTVELYRVGDHGNDDLVLSTTSASDGSFQLGGLPAGDYRLKVVGGGAYTDRWYVGTDVRTVIQVASGTTTTAHVVLAAAGSITGAVSVTGGVVSQVSVIDPSSGEVVASTRNVQRGRYHVPDVPSGQWVVEFATGSTDTAEAQYFGGVPEGDGPSAASRVSVLAGATTSSVDGTLSEGGSIVGTLLGRDGRPLGSCTLWARSGDGRLVPRKATTRNDGAFTLGGLTTGSYVVDVDGADHRCASTTLHYEVGAPTRLTGDPDDADVVEAAVGSVVSIGALTTDRPLPSSALVATTAPTLSGSAPKVGDTITVSRGTWSQGEVRLHYAWTSGGRPVGTDSASYTPTATDLGRPIGVVVTASRVGFTSASATTAETEPVATGAIAVSGEPAITGTAEVGQTLTADMTAVTWTPAAVDVSFRWFADGTEITGATRGTLTLTDAQLGATITVEATASRAGFDGASAETSAPTAPVAAPAPPDPEPTDPQPTDPQPTAIANITSPTITGHPKVGAVLTATPGTWTPSIVAPSYAWLADGTPIRGATGPTLLVAPGLLGRALTVRVTVTAEGHLPATRESARTAKVAAGTITGVRVKVTGTRKVGKTLRAIVTSPPGTSVVYRWTVTVKRKVVTGSKTTLKLTHRLKKGVVRLVVTVSRPGYTPVTMNVSAGKVR